MIVEIIFWILLSIGVGFLGDSRRVGFAGGFFWSLLLSPLIGVIIVLASKRKGDFEEELARVQGRPPKGPPPSPASPQSGDVVERLGKLKEMLESGALTQAEYDAAKKKILD